VAKTLMIVASPPNGGAAASHDGNLAIPAVVGRLQTAMANRPGTIALERAYSVKDLVRVLRAHQAAPPSHVQIIGHGSPGVLSLGRHWTTDEVSADGQHVYSLNSNPYHYGMLSQFLAPGTPVDLIGCSVAANSKTGPVARGSALLFDLADMWQTVVRAPLDIVRADDFSDVDGMFTGPLVSSLSIEAIAAPAAPPPPAALPGVRDAVEFRRLLDIPILGPLHAVGGPAVQPAHASALGRTFQRRVDLSGLLALPEIVFEVRYQGASWPASLIANGRLLRIEVEAQTVYLEAWAAGDTPIEDVGAVCKEIVADQLKAIATAA
jgi:hypothetical protein